MQNNPLDSIAARVQYLIRSKGLRINSLAAKIGLSGQGLRDILSGKSKAPKADVIIALAQELNVTSDWLLFGGDSATANSPFGGFELREPAIAFGTRRTDRSSRQIPILPAGQIPHFIAHYPNLAQVDMLGHLSLPDSLALQGEGMAFEVADDHLAPEIRNGSLVIAGAEGPDLRYLPSGQYYALLFAGHFAIRRVNNLLDRDGVLELLAGSGYASTRVPLSDVQRVWRVQYVIQRV